MLCGGSGSCAAWALSSPFTALRARPASGPGAHVIEYRIIAIDAALSGLFVAYSRNAAAAKEGERK
jgi:hypothetical protein